MVPHEHSISDRAYLNRLPSRGLGSMLRKKDAPDYILEVIELFTPKGELPHARARVRITTHDLGVRLYSLSALTDIRLFVSADPS